MSGMGTLLSMKVFRHARNGRRASGGVDRTPSAADAVRHRPWSTAATA